MLSQNIVMITVSITSSITTYIFDHNIYAFTVWSRQPSTHPLITNLHSTLQCEYEFYLLYAQSAVASACQLVLITCRGYFVVTAQYSLDVCSCSCIYNYNKMNYHYKLHSVPNIPLQLGLQLHKICN